MFNLGAQRCCQIITQGSPGPVGPAGAGFIGPMGSTGPTGASLTGPTGRGCLGQTGPIGSSAGATGPTGPAASAFVNTVFSSLATYNSSTSTLTLPAQTDVIAYYNVDITNGNLTILNPNALPAGYQAIILVTTTSLVTPSTISLTNANNVQTALINYNNFLNTNNPVVGAGVIQLLAQTADYDQYAVITILSNGTSYFATVVGVTNQQPQ